MASSQFPKLTIYRFVQALVLAKQNDTTYGEVLRATRSIVFFAVPHRGGNGTTIGDVVASAMSYLSGGGRNDLIKSLKKSSKLLAYLSADFGHQYEDYHFLSVIESQPLFRVPMNPIRTVGFPVRLRCSPYLTNF